MQQPAEPQEEELFFDGRVPSGDYLYMQQRVLLRKCLRLEERKNYLSALKSIPQWL